MQKITFQDAEVVKAPYVLINGVEYPVIFDTLGGTDLDASTFNTMQNNIESAINEKQATLVSGTNIKTVNNITLLGSGDIDINSIIGSALSVQTEDINAGIFTANEDKFDQTYNVTIPSGYSCLGILGWYLTGGGYTNIFTNKMWFDTTNSQISWSLSNSRGSATATITLTVKLLLVKNTNASI